IWAESEEGRGSTFHFTAQFGIQETPVGPLARLEDSRLHGLSILVVDDNETNRRVLGEMVANWGLSCVAVCDADSAHAEMLRAVNSCRPYAVGLLDVQMPGTDGFQLATRIRADARFHATPLVMLTSGGQPGDAERCQELGVAGYLA